MSGPNSLSYNAYVTQIATMAIVNTQTIAGVIQGVDASFNAIIPQMLSYAENRIARDLDFLSTQTARSYTLTPSVNQFSIPVSDFVTIQTITINGAPLLSVSKEFLQNVYGSSANLSAPVYFAMQGGDLATAGATSMTITVGPWPDTAYSVSVIGTIRAPSLYLNATTNLANSATTFISAELPELLIQASMIYISQFQRNFLPTSNDPEMPGSFEAQYQTLLAGARTEEMRKRFAASAWSSMAPAVVATPTR